MPPIGSDGFFGTPLELATGLLSPPPWHGSYGPRFEIYVHAPDVRAPTRETTWFFLTLDFYCYLRRRFRTAHTSCRTQSHTGHGDKRVRHPFIDDSRLVLSRCTLRVVVRRNRISLSLARRGIRKKLVKYKENENVGFGYTRLREPTADRFAYVILCSAEDVRGSGGGDWRNGQTKCAKITKKLSTRQIRQNVCKKTRFDAHYCNSRSRRNKLTVVYVGEVRFVFRRVCLTFVQHTRSKVRGSCLNATLIDGKRSSIERRMFIVVSKHVYATNKKFH